jgi:predicted HTH domain antitoxin
MRYCARQSDIQVEASLSDQSVAGLTDRQLRYDLVLAHYLAGAISLARAAELLDLPWLDLRARCLRLEISLRTAPADLEQARADAETAAAWTTMSEQ